MAITNDSELAFTAPAAPSPSNLELFPTLTGGGGDGGMGDIAQSVLHGKGHPEVVVEADVNPRLPIGVVVAVLMAVGLVGNGLVLYVYHWKMQRTVFSTFVTVLAALDLCTVLVSMPFDVVIKTSLLDTSSSLNALCKVAHFEVYSTSLASGSVLLLIAVTRYVKVCHPMKPGLSKRQARLLCLLIVLVASLLCTVTFVINGVEKVRLAVGEKDYVGNLTGNTTTSTATVTEGSNILVPTTSSPAVADSANVSITVTEVVEITICRTSEEHKGTVLYYVLQAILMTAFVCIFVSIIVLHGRISIAVKQFERRQSSMRRASMYSAQGDSTTHNPTPITASMFRIFATITVIFVVSYLPHLVCLIVEKSLFSEESSAMPQGTRLVMDLAYNFPYINVVANPFIYGYRSVEFRLHCVMLLHKFFCCGFSCCRRRR